MLTAGIACYRAWLAETEARAGSRRRPLARRVHARSSPPARLSFADALPLVRFRAQAMQEAVPVGAGAMAAILGLDAAAVRRRLRPGRERDRRGRPGGQLQRPEADRHRRQQGRRRQACELLKAAGAKRTLLLAVSAPFHSPLMKPAADRLRERLATVAIDAPYDSGDRQHRREERDRSGGDPRRALSPGVRPGALGRDDPGDPRPRRHPHLRVRPGQGARRPGHAHRARRGRGGGARSGLARRRARRCCDERAAAPRRPRSRSSPAPRAASAGRSRWRSRPRAFASSARRRPKPARRRSAKRWPPSPAAAASSSTSPTATPSARRSTRVVQRRGRRCTSSSTTPASPATCCRCA